MVSSNMKRLTIYSAFIVCLVIAGPAVGHAQTAAQPQMLVTWHARSYVPPDYAGKVLPGANSVITASLEVLDGGKLANLSGQTIYWYVNDNLIDNGTGKQFAYFTAPKIAPNMIDLMIELPSYKGNPLIKNFTIPVVAPEAVIESPLPTNNFSTQSLSVHAMPYFFSVSSPLSLTYIWTVNGVTPPNTQDPQNLTVNVNSGAMSGENVGVGLQIDNPKDDFQTATVNKNFIYAH